MTGFFICKTTSWRFIRYRWVIVKWIGGLFGILVGTALLSPWQIQLVNLSGELENMPVIGGPYDLIRLPFVMIGFLQVYLLLSMIVVSVLKPWGKRIPRQEQARSFAKRSLSPWKSLWAKMDFSNDRR